jgi:hypothetical protein
MMEDKKHPFGCQCGNHKAHNVKFDKPKTAAQKPKTANQVNLPQLGSALLFAPDCRKCKANIRQQVIEEIEKHNVDIRH